MIDTHQHLIYPDCFTYSWASGLPQLQGYFRLEEYRIAREENARCKISGISVYAREDQRTAGGLRPYIETVIEAFTPTRCVWGGDWPVVHLGSGLAKWCELTRELLSPLTFHEQASIFFWQCPPHLHS